MSIYDKPSREMLLEAINRDNNLTGSKALTWNQIASGFPEVIQSEGAQRNTRVLLYGLNGQGYKGNVTIEYDRIDMPTLFRGVVPVVITDPVGKLSELLPFLNEKYGLSLIPDDIVDQSVKDLGESWVLDVQVKNGCLAWQGGFTLRFAKFVPNLKDVVTDVDLSVIVAPYTLGLKPQAEYVTYGYDWTEIKDTLTKDWLYNRTLTAADVDLLNEVVPLNFVYAPPASVKPGQIGLFGAVYKGLVTPTGKDMYDNAYTRVGIIQLDKDSNYTGNLILHFQPV